MRTNEVRIHHEGSGAPRTGWTDAHYALIVYPDGTFRLQFGPEDDTSTKGENGKVLGVCFTGNRMVFDITTAEILGLQRGMREARSAGYVTDRPNVLPHNSSLLWKLGNATACPGIETTDAETWPKVVGACQVVVAPDGMEAFIKNLGTLRLGSTGPTVKYLQGLLNIVYPEAGFQIRGTYGPKTALYVSRFRKTMGLPAGTSVGPRTWAALIYIAGLKASTR